MSEILDYDKIVLLDAEDLAEAGIREAYESLLPELQKYVPKPALIESQNGLRNILISDGTAGWQSETKFVFDGKRYTKSKVTFCDARQDPNSKCDASPK